jgi:phosphopantetheinyl transferase (holo-ACP synthase)
MWRFKAPGSLHGCGIDSEQIGRFEQWNQADTTVDSLIYAPQELDHCRTLSDPRCGLCAAFCCKEALAKAVETLYDFTQCRLLWLPGRSEHHLMLDAQLAREFNIVHAVVRVRMARNVCTAAVFIF